MVLTGAGRSAAGNAAAGGFDVPLGALRDGATWLRGDAGDVRSAVAKAVGALANAHSACGGGPLAGQLSDLHDQFSQRTTALADAVHDAGDRLSQNEATYRGSDSDAARLLGSSVPDGGAHRTAGPVTAR